MAIASVDAEKKLNWLRTPVQEMAGFAVNRLILFTDIILVLLKNDFGKMSINLAVQMLVGRGLKGRARKDMGDSIWTVKIVRLMCVHGF